MRVNNAEICERFVEDDVGHRNSGATMTSVRDEYGDARLYSYNALIGYQDSSTGEILVFVDWYGYSVTTSCHITKLITAIEAAGRSYSQIEFGRHRRTGPDAPEIVARQQEVVEVIDERVPTVSA